MFAAEVLCGLGAMALTTIAVISNIPPLQIPAGLLFFTGFALFIIRRRRGV